MSAISAVTMASLEAIRQAGTPGPLFGMAPGQAERRLRSATEPLLREMGLKFIVLNSCRCCVREWGRHYRLHYGGQLAEALELSLHKYNEHHKVDMESLEMLLARVDAVAGPYAEAWREVFGTGVAR
jgi:predicted RecB family endonuclease